MSVVWFTRYVITQRYRRGALSCLLTPATLTPANVTMCGLTRMAVAFANGPESVEKQQAILIHKEDVLAAIATSHDVVNRPRVNET